MSGQISQSRDEMLSRLSVILTRPAYAGNVGSVARVMANFGVRRCALVSPRCDINSVEARQYATGPSAVNLATMQIVKTMRDALDDASTVVAVTRRTGQMRKPSISLPEIASRLESGKVIMVFGPEESGLSDEDVQNCTDVLTLDVSDGMPSLNLSHALAVVLSRVFEQLAVAAPAKANEAVAISADEFLSLSDRLQQALRLLESNGRISNADRLSRILSQSLSRSRLDDSELAAWHGLVSVLSSK